jgi:NADH-quinone oxidoreductase subunit F
MLFEADEYCGGVRGGRRVKAFIPGGASAMWFFDEHLDMALDKPTVDKAGSMLGSGAIVVMDETTDMVAACWRIVRFFARESCGKCTPCREGTNWLEKVLKRMLDGHGRAQDIDLLMEISESISPGIAWPPRQTTICPLGPSAVSPIASAVRRFRHEFEHYVEHGRAIDGVEPIFGHAVASHG